MATHSSVLAWRIPGTGEPGGLLSVGLLRVGHDWSDLAAAAAAAAVMYRYESWIIKKAECQRIDAFKLWCWRTLESLLNSEIHWKDGCWSWSSNTSVTWCEELTHSKRPWERLKAKGEVGGREWDGYHHWLNRHECEQTPGDSEGQGSMASCSFWGCKESDITLCDWTTTT